MSRVETRLKEIGLVLPPPVQASGGLRLPFPWINVRNDRVFISGHGPQHADGTPSGPFGKVGAEVTVDQGYDLARKVALSMRASVTRELGDLDRVAGWLRVFGTVNAAPTFDRHPAVINGFSEMILDLFGPEVGRHAHSAIGVADPLISQ
jgi:YjgF/chorismate_mutase-like, putative endoribonuclease